MANRLVINSTSQETRVALMENDMVTELYIERKKDLGFVGNIYKGVVVRVLPGMQAAFVDIGLDKAAFLYVDDVFEARGRLEHYLQAIEEYSDATGFLDMADEIPVISEARESAKINELLVEGQEVIVQVAKDPLGTKGARITTHLSLPGRHLVLMPTVDHVGVSRRIEDEKERKRLKDMLESMKPQGIGAIVRTAAEKVSRTKIKADMDFLLKLWKEILKRSKRASAPTMLYSDLNLALRSVRDLFTAEVSEIWVDSSSEYSAMMEFISQFMPRQSRGLKQYKGDEPIFDYFGVEVEISRALNRRVWLRSGGYIVIDQAEALTAIDVNTGRFVGKRSLEDTILKTNLEAVKEIVFQLRLRNIGGIIIIDFIDMDRETNRQKVFSALAEALNRDRAKTNILKISELGLVEMTRKRVRESLGRTLCSPCPYCEGKGFVKDPITVCYEIFREIKREANNFPGVDLLVKAHPDVADLLCDQESPGITELEKSYGKRVAVEHHPEFHLEQFEVIGS
ncbi:MAG: Rne/Rng family ribonuclease [Deltaproteobacteria bacterium]|nr:Rne/Rng family ribonuclease [Deltaproteobacteria bacterium]